MKKKIVWKQIVVMLLCCVMMAGNLLGIYAMESYDKDELSGEDTFLGEDSGKQHEVMVQKECEPDVFLGKSAKWDNIEKGLATLTLTEKDTSDWSDNPADYIIVLDRTRTMVLDDLSFWSENDGDISASHSVCLNENHFYMLAGLPVKLIDYNNGIMMSDKSYFSVDGSTRELWKRHYNSSGTKITPSLSNGCEDRLSLAQKSIKDIMDVLDAQNQEELADGLKNRVMYWSFSGPTYKDINLHPDGIWNEVPKFTSDIANAKNAVKYEAYSGTYYNNSFEKILNEIQNKQLDAQYQNIPTKVIFISDGLQSDDDKSVTAELADQIKAMPNTKIYTILIGNSANSDAGKLLKTYASNEECFATVNSNWSTFVDTITAIQSERFEIKATEKKLVDVIDTRYWEVVGEPQVEAGHGTADLDENKTTLTWNIPDGEGETYTCKLSLKLKDEYRYLLSDTEYPTNADEEGATAEDILEDPKKAGALLQYKISGGKYSGETKELGIQTPELKYGTVAFEGTKHWTVEGCAPEELKIVLKRTMPGSSTTSVINHMITNEAKNWNYQFHVRQLPDGNTYPLIKYNNAGDKIDYVVEEKLPDFYVQVNKSEKESEQKVISDFYNEPYKIKVHLSKIDKENKNPLSGAEFSVYAWSKSANEFVPYKGTKSSVTGAEEMMKLVEESDGQHVTPAWLYYAPDNEGKFRIVETKAPEGYVIASEVFDVVISNSGESGFETQEFYLEVENGITEVNFIKTDLHTGKHIPGVHLQILEKESGNIVTDWISDGTAKCIQGLKLSGDEEQVYIFREIKPADGYVSARDMEFKLVQDKGQSGGQDSYYVLVNDGGEWKTVKEGLIEMKDDVTKVEISKINKKTGKRISGAKLELRDEQGVKVAQWESSEEKGYYIEKLPVGIYTISETDKMEGYKKADDLKIEVKDTAECQKFVFENVPEVKNSVTEVIGNSPKTGDAAMIGAWAALLGGAGISWFLLLKSKRKKAQK